MTANTPPLGRTIERSVILLSAGLDSTVNFYSALRETDVVLAITFNYGQKAAKQEIARSKLIADANRVRHEVIDLPWLKNLGNSGLTSDTGVIPQGKLISLDDKKTSDVTAKAVWIPNRNGIFLNIAAAYAESLKADTIVPGFNAEEAITFPDNSFDFIRATRKALSFSTANSVSVKCYTIAMTKTEIARSGKSLMVPFESIWPCYLAEEKWCGLCESCQRAKRAFVAAHIDVLGNFKN
ncbi:MAG: 7-cyano-7-deazaguanine synthase QueC [Pseudobdellovibrio sp.]